MPAILFVCTANICRSPMAAALFRALIADRPDAADWRVESAGTWAEDGLPAASRTQAVLRQRGLDASQHRSQGVTRRLLNSFDLILTMESGHKEALRAEFPEVAGRTFLLAEMAGPGYDIPDPYGGPTQEFEATAQELETLLARAFPRIAALATRNSPTPDA